MSERYLIAEPEDPESPVLLFRLKPGCYGIGRSQEKAEICLPAPSVSRFHARIFVDDSGQIFIQDEGSSTGVRINDARISPEFSFPVSGDANIMIGSFLLYLADSPPKGLEPVDVASTYQAEFTGDKLFAERKPLKDALADFSKSMLYSGESFRQTLMTIVSESEKTGGAPAENFAATMMPGQASSFTATMSPSQQGGIHATMMGAGAGAAETQPTGEEEKRYTFPKLPEVPVEEQKNVDRFIYRRIKPLFDKLVNERGGGKVARPEEVREMATDILRDLMAQQAVHIPAGIGQPDMVTLCLAAFMDYGPIQTLLGDESVTEIMVNGPNDIFIEQKGKIFKSHYRFFNEQELRRVVEKMVEVTNRRIDEQQAYQDTRLEDGSRVNVVIRPVALRGDSITIRKFPNKRLFIEDLIGFGAMSPEIADFLRNIVIFRANTVVSGGTGSGKTTLLNVLSGFIPEGERLVSIEDAAELRLVQPNKVCLESKPKNSEGGRAITIRDLVINALRMRPDRIVVGECRGGETMDMLQAMNTGHEGSLTTLHANTPRDALNRIETMCLMSGMELPARAIRSQVVSAVNFIVQQSRMADGSRKITSIQEITGMEGEQVIMQEIFKYQRMGMDEKGKIIGKFVATGVIPAFVQELRENRIDFPMDVFNTD